MKNISALTVRFTPIIRWPTTIRSNCLSMPVILKVTAMKTFVCRSGIISAVRPFAVSTRQVSVPVTNTPKTRWAATGWFIPVRKCLSRSVWTNWASRAAPLLTWVCSASRTTLTALSSIIRQARVSLPVSVLHGSRRWGRLTSISPSRLLRKIMTKPRRSA